MNKHDILCRFHEEGREADCTCKVRAMPDFRAGILAQVLSRLYDSFYYIEGHDEELYEARIILNTFERVPLCLYDTDAADACEDAAARREPCPYKCGAPIRQPKLA